MTYRDCLRFVLAAALAAPLVARAAVWTFPGPDPKTSREFAQKHEEAMTKGATHQDASMYAGVPVKQVDPEAAKAWSLRHKQAMDRGLSHIDASRQAGRL